MLPPATTNNYKKNICCHRQLLKIKKKKKSCHRQLPNLRKKMYVAATKQHKNYDYEKMKKKPADNYQILHVATSNTKIMTK